MLKILFYILLIGLVLVLIFSLFGIDIRLGSYKIEFSTFFKKGLPRIDDRFGCWFICGRQGTGKNFESVRLILLQNPNLCNKIYTNVHSLKIPGYKIEYFDRVTDIYYNTEEHCIFLIDEVARKYNKNSRTDDQFYAWLNQSRKKKRIVLLITQEWKELPMWLRRPAKYMFQTSQPNILKLFNLVMTSMGDAENLIFDKDEGEYNCPIIRRYVYKRNKYVADMYDTFESINGL